MDDEKERENEMQSASLSTMLISVSPTSGQSMCRIMPLVHNWRMLGCQHVTPTLRQKSLKYKSREDQPQCTHVGRCAVKLRKALY